MRSMRLNTNLRHTAVLYRRVGVALTAAAVVLMVFASFILGQAAGEARREADSMREMNDRTIEAIAVLEDERKALGIDDVLVQWLLASVAVLQLPRGSSPAAVLYELERLVPAEINLASYSHDFEGQVEIQVLTTNRRELGRLAGHLHASSVFGDVQVINLKESMPGRFEAQINIKGRAR
jgi:hypothetical protein